jgi:lipopolysaccharide/colanic/teichoic acid biosynthesis glycosyltransferase
MRNTVRALDIIGALVGLGLGAPLILIAMSTIWLSDRHSPFYVSDRVGLKGRLFHYLKLRSMKFGSNALRIDTTAAGDPRITNIGKIVRATKVDEIPGLWNVLKGDMSLVGPRPNVSTATNLYTETEVNLLSVKPGMTDLSSIAFYDQAEVLGAHDDPFLAYNQLMRPLKSRLGLLYVNNKCLALDLRIVWLTILAQFSHRAALSELAKIVKKLGADEQLCQMIKREAPLLPSAPPGTDEIIQSREHAVFLSAKDDN